LFRGEVEDIGDGLSVVVGDIEEVLDVVVFELVESWEVMECLPVGVEVVCQEAFEAHDGLPVDELFLCIQGP
jgi:hypothetical protein